MRMRMRSPCPDPAEMERGSTGALRGHQHARDELKLGTGGAGCLGLVPTSPNPPWDAMKSAVQGQPFPSPPRWAGGFGHGIPHSPSPASGRDPPGPAPKQIKGWGGRRERAARGAKGRLGRQPKAAGKGCAQGHCASQFGLEKQEKRKRGGRRGGRRQAQGQRLPHGVQQPPETTAGRDGEAAGIPGPVWAAGEASQPPGHPGSTPRASHRGRGRWALPGVRWAMGPCPANAPVPRAGGSRAGPPQTGLASPGWRRCQEAPGRSEQNIPGQVCRCPRHPGVPASAADVAPEAERGWAMMWQWGGEGGCDGDVKGMQWGM